MEHWAGIAGLATMSFVLLTLIYLIISGMIVKSGKLGTGLLLLVMIIGGAVMVGSQGYSKSLKQRLSKQTQSITDLPWGATKQLDLHREPTNSVSEHTTELLSAYPGQHRAITKEGLNSPPESTLILDLRDRCRAELMFQP